MAEKNLEGLRVAIIATDYFEQAELERPRQALDDAGADTKIVSVKSGQIQGLNHVEKQGLVGLLEKLKGHGLTILVIDHDMHLVEQVADHITVLNFGRCSSCWWTVRAIPCV